MDLIGSFLFILFLGRTIAAFDQTVPLVLVSVLETIKYPLKVTFMSCWQESSRLQFFNALNDRYLTLFTGDHISHFEEDINDHQMFLVVDLCCPNTADLLKSAGQLLYMKYRWLVLDSELLKKKLDEEIQTRQYLDQLSELPLLVSSEIILMIRRGPEDFVVNYVFRTGYDEPLTVETFGTWTNGSFTDRRGLVVTSVRRLNLRGHMLRASMVVTIPETLHHLTDYK
ncbi:uncharacterized protein LOC129725985 [Wyeomyia smithii]|uniref:uncharacterized protein LOC129725985 n=1 Tax=Wyeomyia smithii TaxID=174621 RepID=UPI00246803A4|nr:uncharacterized protein LOC129725985 [Wyeomyia smithii]